MQNIHLPQPVLGQGLAQDPLEFIFTLVLSDDFVQLLGFFGVSPSNSTQFTNQSGTDAGEKLVATTSRV